MPAADIDKIARAAGDRPFGFTPLAYGYQSTLWIGRLRFHVFHREDPGAACHDHPWSFWTFPLTAYVEEVLDAATGELRRQVVPAFWLTWRDWTHTHRVIGRSAGAVVAGVPQPRSGPILTIVWRGRNRGGEAWHYVVALAGKIHRVPWRRYLAIADRRPRT